MNIYLLILLIILLGGYLLNVTVDILNIKHSGNELPEEFADYYNPEKYKKSIEYLKKNTYFDIVHEGIILCVIIIFILGGGFN